MKLTARSRLETYASVSRVQSEEETYDLERTVVGSVLAGTTADRCGQCCACDRTVVSVAVGDGEVSDMEIKVEPFGYLVQTTSDKNPPHGWAVYMFSGKDVEGSIPFYLAEAVEYMRKECERAWREVDSIAKERDQHELWRRDLAGELAECERMRDALGIQLNKYHAVYSAANALMARLGHDGTIDTNSQLVETLMNALDEINPKGWL